jgi:hypothetical protein
MTKLDAEDTYIDDVFSGKTVYQVPDFQREYSWQKKQLQDLWDDLQRGIENNREHHLDQIKFVPDEDGNPTTYKIIDGQQRLATLSLMICAMKEVYEQRGAGDGVERQLQNMLVARDLDATAVRRLRLLDGSGNDADWEHIWNNGDTEGLDSKISRAYDFYHTRFKRCDTDRLDEFRKYIIDKVSVVTLTVSDMLQAYVMFQGNSRGLDLTPIQMTKSVIMQIAHRRGKSDFERVKTLWSDVLELAESADPAKPRRPINDVLLVTDRFGTEKDITGDGFIRHIEDIFSTKTRESVQSVLSWLVGNLEEYEKVCQAKVRRFNEPENAHINALIRQFTEQNPYAGLVLFWLFENKSRAGEMISALDWCSKLSMRLYLADASTYERKDAIQGVWQKLKNGVSAPSAAKKQMNQHTPVDPTLDMQLQKRELPRNKVTRNILYRIEAEHFSGPAVGGSDYPAPGEDIEIEHIAPMQTFSADKYSRWRPVFGRREGKFKTHRKRLGNLTLLRSRRNMEAGTDPFSEKKDYYKKSDFGMTQKIDRQYESWDFANIEDRTNHMANLAVRTFSTGNYTKQPVSTGDTPDDGKIRDYVGGTDD